MAAAIRQPPVRLPLPPVGGRRHRSLRRKPWHSRGPRSSGGPRPEAGRKEAISAPVAVDVAPRADVPAVSVAGRKSVIGPRQRPAGNRSLLRVALDRGLLVQPRHAEVRMPVSVHAAFRPHGGAKYRESEAQSPGADGWREQECGKGAGQTSRSDAPSRAWLIWQPGYVKDAGRVRVRSRRQAPERTRERSRSRKCRPSDSPRLLPGFPACDATDQSRLKGKSNTTGDSPTKSARRA